MGTDRSDINRNDLNIEYIKIVVEKIVEVYFNEPSYELSDIISEMRNRYDCY